MIVAKKPEILFKLEGNSFKSRIKKDTVLQWSNVPCNILVVKSPPAVMKDFLWVFNLLAKFNFFTEVQT